MTKEQLEAKISQLEDRLNALDPSRKLTGLPSPPTAPPKKKGVAPKYVMGGPPKPPELPKAKLGSAPLPPLYPLPKAPANMGGYPAMGDWGKNPGFKLATAGNNYSWTGGDRSRVTVGDKRAIIGGESVQHVNGTRLSRVGGFTTSEYFSGRKTITHGPVTSIIHEGPKIQELNGNQISTINGNQTSFLNGSKKSRTTGFREEVNTGGRYERWSPFKAEIGVGGKFEAIAGAKVETVAVLKWTSVVGAKVDHIEGFKIEIGKSPEKKNFPGGSWNYASGLLLVSKWFREKVKKKRTEAESIETEAKKIKNKGNVENDGNLKVTEEVKTEGPVSLTRGTLKIKDSKSKCTSCPPEEMDETVKYILGLEGQSVPKCNFTF